MLSIGKMGSGQESYYDNLATQDYYIDGGEPPGQWFGQGANHLRLTDQVNSEIFTDVFQGKLRGKTLVGAPPKGYERAPGWDLTFSAPKSVSVIFSQADYEESKKVREAQQAAVEKALSYVEEKCGFTRRGKGGAFVENAKCVFSTFEHGTSRAEQPQLHTHALMINLCVREDGTTGTLKTEKLYDHKMAAGAIYRAELAYQLEQRLGVEILKDGFSFKVAGVDDKLCEHFSKRRQEIEGKLDDLGLNGARASAFVALSTRSTKGTISRQDLIKEWKETGASFGWSTKELHAILGKSQAQPEVILKNHAALAALEGIEHMMETKSYFTEKDAVRFTCEFSQGRGVPADLALEATEEALKTEEMVNLGVHDGERHYTTKAHLKLEAQMMEDVVTLKNREGIKVSAKAIETAFQASADEKKPLSPEQETAARHILEGPGRISTIVGDAGTGKTTVLKPVAAALKDSGYQVQGIALAGKAATGMQEGSGIESGTIASFLWIQDKIQAGWNEKQAKAEFYDWVAEERKRRGPQLGRKEIFDPQWTQKTADNSWNRFCDFKDKYSLGPNSVLVIDEAGMVDTPQLAKVTSIVKESGGKLVEIGDQKQLQAITQGGGFKGVSEEVQGPRLTEIFRQEDEKEKAAVRNMAEGNVREALDHYVEEGRLDVLEEKESAKSQLLEDWSQNGISRPDENLILAGVNVDVYELNKRAQQARVESGQLRGKSIKVGNSDFHQGERVIFMETRKKMGVSNGDFGVVRGFNSTMGTISVELDGEGPAHERTRKFSLKNYSELKLGYAVTTHKAQGMTVKNAFVVTDERMCDLQMTYVQLSRVKAEARIYTTQAEAGDNLSDLVKSMSRDREKTMALELAVKQAQAEAQARRMAEQNLHL